MTKPQCPNGMICISGIVSARNAALQCAMSWILSTYITRQITTTNFIPIQSDGKLTTAVAYAVCDWLVTTNECHKDLIPGYKSN